MYHHFLNEPIVLDAEKTSILTLRLPDDISDFMVLQAISAPPASTTDTRVNAKF